MIPVSNAFIAALAQGNRQFVYTLAVELQNGTSLEITNNNIMLGGVSFEDAVSDESGFKALGAAVINCSEIQLWNKDKQFSQYDFKNAQVTLSMGLMLSGSLESFQRGVYIVDKAIVNDNANTITLSTLDFMVLFDTPYTTSLTYPTSVANVLTELCAQCEVEYDGTMPAVFSAITVPNAPDVDTTCRDVLSSLATIVGCYARITRLGKLKLDWFSLVKDGNISKSEISSQTGDNNEIVITGVSIEYTNDDGDTVTIDSTTTEGYFVKVSNNIFINQTNAQSILNYLASKLVGTTFRNGEVTHYSDPRIEAGDVIEVTNRYNDSYNILVTQVRFSAGAYQITKNSSESLSDNINARTNRSYNRVRYTWTVYADDAQGTNINTESGPYIGTAYNKLTSTPDLTDPSIYTWTKRSANILIFKTGFVMSGNNYNFTAYVYNQDGDDVTSNYAPTKFTWFLRTEEGTTNLGTGYTKTVTSASLGYGGTVVCRFQDEILEMYLLTSGGDQLTTRSGDKLVGRI